MRLILGPILGAVSYNKAKIWIFWSKDHDNETEPQCLVYSDEACTHEITNSVFLTVSSSVHETGSIRGVAGLANITFPPGEKRLFYKIKSFSQTDAEPDRVYSFLPFPEDEDGIEEFSFALVSCHKPTYIPKKDKKIVAPMWSRLEEEMRRHNCRFLIQAGDQVYADNKNYDVWEKSLNEASQEKRLWNYRSAYLKSWSFQEVQNVMQAFPQYMIWDDHEITNGWGSNKEHSQEVKYKRVFEDARQVYHEFQHCHNPDSLRKDKLYFSFNYGPVTFLFMDLRGHRDITLYDSTKPVANSPLVGEEQWDDIENLLKSESLQKAKNLFVATSVPVCHLNRKFGSLGIFKNDIRDQWSAPHNKMERKKLLNLLYQWSGDEKKPVFILGGDVHVGTLAHITEEDTGKKIHQITSSPITNNPSKFLDFFLAIFSKKFEFHLDKEKQRTVKGEITKRFRKRNFAIIKLCWSNNKPTVALHMFEEGKSEPYTVELS
jgi:alkaline phosphatase D